MLFFLNIDYEERIVRRQGPENQVLLERVEAHVEEDQEYHRERCSITDKQKEDYIMDREAEREEKREERVERELIRRQYMEQMEAEIMEWKVERDDRIAEKQAERVDREREKQADRAQREAERVETKWQVIIAYIF